MKSLFHHVETVRAKPHHVRRRIAFGVSGGITSLIAVVWFTGSFASGAFTIPQSAYGNTPTTDAVTVVQHAGADISGIAGAAAALPAARSNAPAHIEIVSAPAATSTAKEQTVIPF